MQEERRDQSEEARIARLKWSLLRQGYLLELQPWNKVFKQEYEATLDEYSRVLEKVEVLNGMD